MANIVISFNVWPSFGLLQGDCRSPEVEDVEDESQWRVWVAHNTSRKSSSYYDYGLEAIASHLGQHGAIRQYFEGVEKENPGDVGLVIKLYFKNAFRMCPSLDSISCGGIPLCVREESMMARLSGIHMDVVDVDAARSSRVVLAQGFLDGRDFASVEMVRVTALAGETILANNPENSTHHCKENTFLHVPPTYYAYDLAPRVFGKMLHFAARAWESALWSWTETAPGPLYDIGKAGGIASLSILEALLPCQFEWLSTGNTQSVVDYSILCTTMWIVFLQLLLC